MSNKTLAAVALILASLALVAGTSLNGRKVSVDPKEMAYRIQHELDHVSPEELNTWITEKREGYRLIDLRSEEEFINYHIPGAENLDLVKLADTGIEKDQTLVLYSEGGVHSAQAMFLLWTQGYRRVFMLKGGIAAWEADVLHVSPSVHSDDHSHSRDSTGIKKIPVPELKESEKFRREC